MKGPTFFFNLLKGQGLNLLFEHSLGYKQQKTLIFKPSRAIENTETVPPPLRSSAQNLLGAKHYPRFTS